MLRLLLLALVVIGLAPGTFVRTDTGARGDIAVVTIARLTDRGITKGDLTLTGAWTLSSPHNRFGGFSALVAKGPSGLIAGTDRGWLLEIATQAGQPRSVPGSFTFIGREDEGLHEVVDLEALARDPATGTLWAAFENNNQIDRIATDGARRFFSPPQIADWSANSGPETMERLIDGRFMVLSEGPEQRGMRDRPGLMYPGDPLLGAQPFAFRFDCHADFAPVDATQVPDGRVLLLLRRVEYALPARFDAAIAIGNPADIRAGAFWRVKVIQHLSGPVFGENFEGIAYQPDPANPQTGSVWLIADDNFSVFQQTLLLRFAWNGQGPDERRRSNAKGARSSTPNALEICGPAKR